MNVIGGVGVGGRGENELELCEMWQFQFTGLWAHFFQFHFMQVFLLWREILTFRLKEVKRSPNHIIWRTFRLSRGGERGGKVAPASFQCLLQKFAPGSPPEFCDSWSALLLADSNELATQIPIYLASPGAPVPKSKPILGERASHGGTGKTYPERPTCLQMSFCWPFWNPTWGLGWWSMENLGWNPTSTTYYLYDLGVLLITKLLMQMLMIFKNS